MIKSCPTCQTTHDDTTGACPAQSGRFAKEGDDRLLGTIVRDRYRIIGRLGKGGMGVVYKAEQLADGRHVALKVLHRHLVTDPEAIKRFQHEAKAASSLMHPHIARILDFGMTPNGQPYIAMEFLDGRTLGELIREKHFYTLPEALPLIRQTCEALAEAHSHGILHRDMKPANIMLLNRFGQADHVVVVDFSISKVIQKVSDHDTTLPGTVLGSPAYMSPERFKGKSGDFRSDIYSLGIIMFQMLAGRPPFRSEKLYALMNEHVSTPPPRLQDVNPLADIPQSMQTTIERALMKNPADRQANVKELLAELEEIYHEIRVTAQVVAASDGDSTAQAPQATQPSLSLRNTQELPPTPPAAATGQARSETVFFEVNPGLTPPVAGSSSAANNKARQFAPDERLQSLANESFSSGKWDKKQLSRTQSLRPNPHGTLANPSVFPLKAAALIAITLALTAAAFCILQLAERPTRSIEALLREDKLTAAMSIISSWHPPAQDTQQTERYGQSCLSLGKAFMHKRDLGQAAAVLGMVPPSSTAYDEARTLAKQCRQPSPGGE